ncbi:MAG: hypothetical protein ACRYF0_03980 [Janthinobacterium lividum]
MKALLLLASLLLTGGSVAAQTAPVAASAGLTAAAPTARLAAPDTLAALHRLFATKRQRQGYIVGGTVVAAVGTAGLVVANRPAESGSSNGGEFGVVAPNNLDLAMVGVVAVPVVLAEALLLGGWGHKYEQRVIATWQQQHQLPRSVRRQLKPSYFH